MCYKKCNKRIWTAPAVKGLIISTLELKTVSYPSVIIYYELTFIGHTPDDVGIYLSVTSIYSNIQQYTAMANVFNVSPAIGGG